VRQILEEWLKVDVVNGGGCAVLCKCDEVCIHTHKQRREETFASSSVPLRCVAPSGP